MHEIDQFGQFKIITIVATRSHFLKAKKCIKFDFDCGFGSDPAGGAHSAPQTPKLDFRGSYF